MKFFVEKQKFNFSGGWGLKKTKITQNMPKLGHYLPFEQKNPKIKFFEKNLNINFLGGWGLKNPKQPKICPNQVIEHKIQK